MRIRKLMVWFASLKIKFELKIFCSSTWFSAGPVLCRPRDAERLGFNYVLKWQLILTSCLR